MDLGEFDSLRILHLTFSLENAGKENLMVDIAVEQQKLGHATAIAVINSNIEASILNRIPHSVPTYLLNRGRRSKNPLAFIKLFDILHRRFKPNVVHVHDAHLGPMLKKMHAPRPVLTIHDNGYPINPLREFDKLFAISDSVKIDVESRSNLTCKTIYNGINVDAIKRAERRALTDGPVKLIQVSRLDHHKKGQDLLLLAMHDLIAERCLKNIHLTLVGSGDSYEYLCSMMQSLALENHVSFIGNKPRAWVYDNLCRYDLYVQPSRYEGFGLTLAEALAARILSITSSNTGSAEILDKGQYGLMFINGNYRDLANTIQHAVELIRNNQSDSITDAAWNYCRENFSISETALSYLNSYL